MKESRPLARLKRVLLKDNLRIPNSVIDVLQSDMQSLLEGYLDIRENSYKMTFSVNEEGIYRIEMTALATAVKPVKAMR